MIHHRAQHPAVVTDEVTEWSGYPDPHDPDHYWIDDVTGERVNAHTGERSDPGPVSRTPCLIPPKRPKRSRREE